jgi:hypothetical protein
VTCDPPPRNARTCRTDAGEPPVTSPGATLRPGQSRWLRPAGG